MSDNDGVFRGPWRDLELDLGMSCGKPRENGLDETAEEEDGSEKALEEEVRVTYFMPLELPAQSQ